MSEIGATLEFLSSCAFHQPPMFCRPSWLPQPAPQSSQPALLLFLPLQYDCPTTLRTKPLTLFNLKKVSPFNLSSFEGCFVGHEGPVHKATAKNRRVGAGELAIEHQQERSVLRDQKAARGKCQTEGEEPGSRKRASTDK